MMDARADRSLRRTGVAIAVVHIALGFLLLTPGYLNPDSTAIYAYLRSMLFDGDLMFFNEWGGVGLIRDGVTMFKEITPVGALANHWWIGTSLLSMPAYALAHVTVKLSGGAGNGFSGLYAFALAWSTVAFGAIASLFALRVAAPATAVDRRRFLAALALVWVGTPLLFYQYRFPLGTHLAGALSVAAAVWYLLRACDEDDRTAAFVSGLWFGLAVATRLQHVMLAPGVILFILLRRRPRHVAIVAAGGAFAAAVQAIAWLAIYGHPLGPLASGASHVGSTWMPFTRNALGAVLVSSWHGLLSWSPVLILAIVGWFAALRDERRHEALLYLTMFAGEWVANGLFDRYFWGGLSFGGRRFIDLALPFALGAYWCIRRWPRAAVVTGTLFAAWNAALAAAAAAGRLELSADVSFRELVAAVSGLSAGALRSIVASAPGLGGTTAALTAGSMLLVLVAFASTIAALRSRRTHAAILTLYLLGWVVSIAAAIPAMRRNAAEWHRLMGIDTRRSAAVGPLLDERNLLRDEWVYLRNRGRLEEAAATEADLTEVQRRIDALMR